MDREKKAAVKIAKKGAEKIAQKDAEKSFPTDREQSLSIQRKAGSTLRTSRAVPHLSTIRALRRLTSEF